MPNRPVLIVEIEVMHRPHIAVGRVNREAVEIPDVPKHRRLPWPPCPLGPGARSFQFLARPAPARVLGNAGSPIVPGTHRWPFTAPSWPAHSRSHHPLRVMPSHSSPAPCRMWPCILQRRNSLLSSSRLSRSFVKSGRITAQRTPLPSATCDDLGREARCGRVEERAERTGRGGTGG